MSMVLLGVLGPVQGLLSLLILAAPVIIMVIIINNSRTKTKNKPKSNTLDSIPEDESLASDDTYSKIQRLYKLYREGELSKEEFEAEKRKLIQ
ncbi:MAG: SHOCT domain-containing protein [Crocinitomicaceae bacterium]|nr:SHOCT domain-containing protein [Crocinitomicaceae bacterium]MBK8927128.1 SHOCT domain-containing protein [Crocinitomicaceae bacterium]